MTVLAFGTTFANAGILISDAPTSENNTCAAEKDGVVIENILGVVIENILGILISDRKGVVIENAPTTCTNGILISD